MVPILGCPGSLRPSSPVMRRMPGQKQRERLVGMFVDELHSLSRLRVWFPVAIKLPFPVFRPVIGPLGVEYDRAIVGQKAAVEAVAVGSGGDGTYAVPSIKMPLPYVAC